jgi:hypothetical protein
MRASERVVTLLDFQGRREFLRVEHDFLTVQGDQTYLPVGVVAEDRDKQLVLVELPQEGECGSWRMWVRPADLIYYPNGDAP